jgi:hypothetical protein
MRKPLPPDRLRVIQKKNDPGFYIEVERHPWFNWIRKIFGPKLLTRDSVGLHGMMPVRYYTCDDAVERMTQIANNQMATYKRELEDYAECQKITDENIHTEWM